MSVQLNQGVLETLTVGGHVYRFRPEPQYCGPVFHVVCGGQERVGYPMQPTEDGYSVSFWGVEMTQRVEETPDGCVIRVRIRNRSSQTFRPERVSLKLGIDTYMDTYPEWNEKVFPTLLRCEKTHFWGYFRSPNGKLLGIACPEPVAGWALDYNYGFSDSLHRIYTARLDLLSGEKQPPRHPCVDRVLPGQELTWSIALFDETDLPSVLQTCSRLCRAPVADTPSLIFEKEAAEIRVYSESMPEAEGCEVFLSGRGVWNLTLPAGEKPGPVTLNLSADGHESEVLCFRRKPWRFYMEAARDEALAKPQKTGSHAESWYGLFSGFMAARYLPCPEKDRQILDKFNELLPLAFDAQRGEPTLIPWRIQNTATVVSLCEDAWQATGDISWLEKGARFADFLIDKCQREDGAFASGRTHYTCVIYIAKSLMELWMVESRLPGEVWQARAKKHFAAVKRAMDDLALHKDNIETEGEMTFEDGMISCCASQLAMFALLLPEAERAPYVAAAEEVMAKHRCLERLGSPDARSRNTTIRYWEAQYDVLALNNMINSPHGWSGWKVYGTWYLYLLTGKVEYLTDTMETLGSCVQLMGLDGTLRWAFIPDPCVHSGLWMPGEDGKGIMERRVFGETYLDMISGWYRAPENTPVFGYLGDFPQFDTDEGGCCDNDVHEIFKAMAEVALPYSYLYTEDGPFHLPAAMNAAVMEDEGGTLTVTPADSVVTAVHVNLWRPQKVRAEFASGTVEAVLARGWLKADGTVEQGLPRV